MKRIGLLFLFVTVLMSCEKDDEGEQQTQVPDTPKPELRLSFDFLYQEEAIQKFAHYYAEDSTIFHVEDIRFYLSEFKLVEENGDTLELEDYFLLVSMDSAEQVMKDVPEGKYKGVHFSIGLPEAINNQSEADFTNRPLGDPLGVQAPSMHWSWSTGYVFFRFQGWKAVDNEPLTFHIGNDELLRKVGFTPAFEVRKEDNPKLNFALDVDVLIRDLDYSTEFFTMTIGGDEGEYELAEKIANRLPDVFRLKQ